MSFQRLSEKLRKIVDLQFPLQSHADNTEGASRKLIGLKIFHNYTFWRLIVRWGTQTKDKI